MTNQLLYSIRWKQLARNPSTPFNVIPVQITFLDEQGTEFTKTFQYEEWFGVCTNRIERFVSRFKKYFPNHSLRYEMLGPKRKVLPYFRKRLDSGKLDYAEKPFYKVYTTACHEDVGRFFNKYKIAYYDKSEWLIRIYIDLCTRYKTMAFYYAWYNVGTQTNLVDALVMLPERHSLPDFTVGAFDIETVPMDRAEDRVPTGLDPSDKITMISLYRWNKRKGVQKFLLYLLPPDTTTKIASFPNSYAYKTEEVMLQDFHRLLNKCHVVTGYNINKFDFKCIVCRLLFLKMFNVLALYSSECVGTEIVIKYRDKITVDLYNYFKTFSGYDLPGFKLDDVSRAKLKDETKIPIKSQGIWYWYTRPETFRWVHSDDRDACHAALNPRQIPLDQFGTFRMYMEYCLHDSKLVYMLFEKETVLDFLVSRANFSSLPVEHALLLGNSSFLKDVLKTYGTLLGFFVNTHFFNDQTESEKYQGALNRSKLQHAVENVVVLDFVSMYPSTLQSANLCYGTCAILTTEEWLASPRAQTLTTIPYRNHSDENFETDEWGSDSDHFQYPKFDPDKDSLAIVVNQNTKAFLPTVVQHFKELRKMHQRLWKETKNVYHYNAQLCIKLLINAQYGIMANKNSCLYYLDIAKATVCISRNQILGAHHLCKYLKYDPCYIDTDSLMIPNWPWDHCQPINKWLNLPYVELKYEQRMKRLLVLCKKRYIYETPEGTIVTKGFQKRINPVIEFMSETILKIAWKAIFERQQDDISLSSRGWIVWVDTLLHVAYMCRDPKKFSICRKTKNIEDYKSESCTAMRILSKYPERANDYVEYTFSRSDGAESEACKWVLDAEDCKFVNYEQLFMSQKLIYCTLLNIGFWKLTDPVKWCNLILNTLRWKNFVHAELKFYCKTGKRFLLLVEPAVRYTFQINDHLKRKRGTLVLDEGREKEIKRLKKEHKPTNDHLKRKRGTLVLDEGREKEIKRFKKKHTPTND